MQKSKTRLTYIDIVKAIAMISVVMFHACTNHENTYLASNAFLIRFTSAYAMPVFFFINGFLYKNKEPMHPVKGIWTKIKSYYFPFVCYNLFYLLMHNIFVLLHMVDEQYGNGYYNLKEFAKHFVKAITGHREYFAGALWFLGSILIINTIFIVCEYVIYKLALEKYRIVLLGVIASICLLAGNSGMITDRMKIETSLANLIYFYIGILYRKYDWNKQLIRHRWSLIISGILVNLLVSYNKLYNPMGWENGWLFTVLDYINALICIGAIMAIAQINRIEKSKVLRLVGRNTLDIMALHFMLFKPVSLVIIWTYSMPITRLAEYPVLHGVGGAWWFLYTFVALITSTAFSIWRHKLFKKRK